MTGMLAYTDVEVVNLGMTDKEALISLIDRLGANRISALKKVVEAMVSPALPEVEPTTEEFAAIYMGLKEIKNGEYHVYKNIDELRKDLLDD